MKARWTLLIALCLAAVIAGGWLAMRGDPAPPSTVSPATWDAADPHLGRKAYAMCQACHGSDGRGVPGYAPGLAGSPWLTGDARGAILITLHGYDATPEPGSAYVSARMLAHGTRLADHEIAGLLSWSRTQWGNNAPAIERAQVTALRQRFATRTAPWTPAELRQLLAAP